MLKFYDDVAEIPFEIMFDFHCSVLAQDAIKAALSDYRKKNTKSQDEAVPKEQASSAAN